MARDFPYSGEAVLHCELLYPYTSLCFTLVVCLQRVCSTLVPKANAWLLEASSGLQLIKCESIERKVTSYGDVGADNVLFVPRDGHAIYVKGLRYDDETVATVPVARSRIAAFAQIDPSCSSGGADVHPDLIMLFIGPSEPALPNGISNIFSQLTVITDTQNDKLQTVEIGGAASALVCAAVPNNDHR